MIFFSYSFESAPVGFVLAVVIGSDGMSWYVDTQAVFPDLTDYQSMIFAKSNARVRIFATAQSRIFVANGTLSVCLESEHLSYIQQIWTPRRAHGRISGLARIVC